jgi:hypothetical protein
MSSSTQCSSGGNHGTWAATTVPFTRDAQLCHKLIEKHDGAGGGNSQRELQPTTSSHAWLPGYPRVLLKQDEMMACVQREMTTPMLDAMHPYLWLVASEASDHVSPLTEQIVRGREIVVTENPELHLLWAHSRIYIKPIPDFLLSYDFWSVCLTDATGLVAPLVRPTLEASRRASLGYLRTYHHLIRHKSDFIIAQKAHLIPKDVDFPRLMNFLAPFGSISDSAVNLRYRFGQLRLTRLNIWAPIALRQFHFYKVRWQYADVFAQFYAPVLLVFGFFSIILAAMQVGTQARPAWDTFASVSAWFAVASLLVVVGIGIIMALLLVFMLLRELTFALKKKLGWHVRHVANS